MTSRSSSTSVPRRPNNRRSFSSRLSFAVSNAERGQNGGLVRGEEHQIDEEIEEIKRYEVGTTFRGFLGGMLIFYVDRISRQ